MSTKTTFKRVALVTVAALGFGMVGAITPANAAFTASFSAPVTSVTMIVPTSGYDSTTASGAIFKIVLRNDGTDKTSQSLQVGETLTASVIGVPVGNGAAKTLSANVGDLGLMKATPVTAATVAGNPYSITARAAFTNSDTSTTSGSIAFGSLDTPTQETTTTDFANSLYLKVIPRGTVVDEGEYSIRLRLTSANGALLVQETTIKVKFVSTPIGAGFTLTAGAAGNFAKGEAAITAYSSTKYLTATLKDSNGGRVVSETTAGSPSVPALTADVVDSLGAVINTGGALTAVDAGATTDYGYSALGTAAATNANNQLKGNGVYGITAAASWLDTATTAAAGGADTLRVRFADKTATAALTINNAAAGTATLTIAAVGRSVLDSTALAATLPLTTKTATFTVTGATAGNAVIFTPTWTGCATGDRSHVSATAVTQYADSTGASSLAITCAAPTDATSVSVAVTGFTTGATAVASWYASAAQTMSVSLNGAIFALKSTNTFVATVTDRFGAPVAGVVLTPAVDTTGSNGSATRTYTSVTTDAKGTASYALTDALAIATGTDTVSFAHVTSGTAITSASSTITYAATEPAPTSVLVFHSPAGNATQSVTSIATPVPAEGIYKTGTTEFSIVTARDNSRIIATTGNDQLTIRVRAVEGAAVKATASSGAYVRNSANLASSSRTRYGSAVLGDVYFVVGSNKTGANTITITSGTATSTVNFWVKNAAADIRFVTLTGPATATANGDLQSYKVTVTDRYANPVPGATVTLSATGVAAFGGGSTVQSITTGASGEFTFTGTSLASAGGAGAFKAEVTNTSTDNASLAGLVGTTPVESTLAAGNASVTLSVVFAAGSGSATVAAEAATDAAAEATDAANAATDAANAAAEAADAATAAAQDAADAVAALSAQVATLISGLKAQLTALTNLVIKIQKKVKA